MKDGYEADDMIAALAAVTDHIIWSKDKDLLAAGNWWWSGELNPTDKFLGIDRKHIVVYKSLVGDTSDKIPGANGFGEVALTNLIAKFGDDTLDEILDMIKNKELHKLSDYVEDFKPFQKIIDNADAVYASYNCARFHHPGWTGINWQARFPHPNGDLGKWKKVEQLITKAIFNSPGWMDKFISDLHDGPVNVRGFDIETWMDEESLAWAELNKPKTGRGPIDVVGCHMAGFSLTCGENNEKVYYFPVDHKDTDNISLEDMTMILNMLPDDVTLMIHNVGYELPVVRKECELRFDRGWLPGARCSQIMKNYVDENTELGLKYCTKHYLGYKQVSYQDVTEGKQMNELTGEHILSYGADDSVGTVMLGSLFDLIMRYEGTMYAFEECELLPAYLFAESQLNGFKFDFKRLTQLYNESKARYAERYKKIQDFLLNLVWKTGDFDDGVVFEHRWEGVELEPAESLIGPEIKRVFLAVTGEELKSSLRKPEAIGKLICDRGYEPLGKHVIAGDLRSFNAAATASFIPNPQINLKSTPQLAKLFYDALKLPVRVYGKLSDTMRAEGRRKGNPATDEDATRLAMAYDCEGRPEVKELLENILKAKEEKTAESFYYLPYPKTPNPKTGMTHYSSSQSRTVTRRHAPKAPNIGQVSKKSPIREAFVPFDDSMAWMVLDKSQQELRLTAHRSQCPEMLACYPVNGPSKDIHCVTGVQVAKIRFNTETTYEEMVARKKEKGSVFDKARDEAKPVNFGDVYGQTKFGLALKLVITEEAAQDIIDAKAAAFPGVAQWKKDRAKFIKENGYAITMMGARRHINLTGTWKDEGDIRGGINFEIQSPAAEQVKLDLAEFWKSRFFEKFDAYFMFPVHDEVDIIVSEKDLIPAAKEAHRIMSRQFCDMKIPVTSSIKIGTNFGNVEDTGEVFDADKIQKAWRKARESK